MSSYAHHKAIGDAVKFASQCEQCRKRHDSTVYPAEDLEFHHIEPSRKIKEVTAWYGTSREKMFQEMSLCSVLCLACHDETEGKAILRTPSAKKDYTGEN